MEIKRGNIHLAALDPVARAEIIRTHQVVVISNDQNNQFSNTVTVLPLTSQKVAKIYPFEAFLSKGQGGLAKDAKVKADQVRTIDKKRLVALVGKLDDKELTSLEQALKIHLALP